MFQLLPGEKNELVTNWHRFISMRHSATAPYAFTEHGVAMLASVLNSERAIKISISIIKAFVKLRQILSTHKELVGKLSELEHRPHCSCLVEDRITEMERGLAAKPSHRVIADAEAAILNGPLEPSTVG